VGYINEERCRASWWYHYDEAHVDELATRLAPDVHYVCRSDSGASPFEEMVRADTRGRQDTMTWLVDHRRNSPYPLRHFGGNVFRVGAESGSGAFGSYLFVTKIVRSLPVNVSTGMVWGTVYRGPDGPWFTSMETVLDTRDSVPLSTLASAVPTGAGLGRSR